MKKVCFQISHMCKSFYTINILLFCVCSQAQIHHAPANFTSIQAAINASVKGDTVLVDPGRYYENINFRGKSIVVASKFLTTDVAKLIYNP